MPDQAARLLIIDDKPASIGLLLAYLEKCELEIMVALDGADGLEKARLGRPELILLDVTMPMMDGLAVCRRLKAMPETAGIPVIFLSAAVDLETKLEGFAAGAADYITKPFTPQEVLARVFVQLGQRQRLQQLNHPPADENAGSAGMSRAQFEQRLFTQAVALLNQTIADPPRLPELAHRVGTNARRLTEVFREQVGMTVFDYLEDLRLERARHLLRNSELQIQLITERVGYRNAGDFARAFRRHFGVSPREYRQGRIEADNHEQ